MAMMKQKEYQQIKAMGDGLYPQFFIDSLGTGTRTQPCAELLALYDDQVHDSRAWFMQSSLGGREPWGGYFRYRMIYFGDEVSQALEAYMTDRERQPSLLPDTKKRSLFL